MTMHRRNLSIAYSVILFNFVLNWYCHFQIKTFNDLVKIKAVISQEPLLQQYFL